jgi:ornithine cyclodeaminase
MADVGPGPAVLGLREIRALVDVPQLIRDIEEGFRLYARGRVTVPPVGFLHFEDPPGDVHIKYGAVSDDEWWVLKVASAFYANPDAGLPSGDGAILVFSQKTGALELVLHDRGWLTDMRTAAAGAVAARHLAPSEVECIGIVGTGVQARMQLQLLRDVVHCDRCLVWGRSGPKASAMVEELRGTDWVRAWGLDVDTAPTLERITAECRLIVTTTASRAPLFGADGVAPGTHITAMGSDDHGKQELDARLLGRADIVVADSRVQCVDHGECAPAVRDGQLAASSIVELGEVIDDPSRGRTHPDQITIADLTGVAIQDIQIAKMVAGAFFRG